MADKSINELPAASQVTPSDLFVLQQSNAAKKLTGQVLENWLVSLADGHGGIQSIVKKSTSGLVDTYRITLADTTTFDFTVTNGKSITGISKASTNGLVDTYRIAYNDGTHTAFHVVNGRGITKFEKVSTDGLIDTYKFTYNDGEPSTFSIANGNGIKAFEKVSTVGLVDTYKITYSDWTSNTFTVTNGAKGDKGDNSHVWIRYSSQKPTDASHDFGVLPDDWMGVYSGYSATAPTDWQEYQWSKTKGDKGDTGDAATVQSFAVEYMGSDSGTIVPSGSWQPTVPAIVQGKYLWTRITIRFNTGDPVVAYSVSRYGLDGTGSVSMVNQKSPDSNGNVQLTSSDVGARPDTWTPTAEDVGARPDTWMPTAADVRALPASGGTMQGSIDMGGHRITGLGDPTADTDAVNKRYAAGLRVRNLLDNSDFRDPVNQRGQTTYICNDYIYTIDRWRSNTKSSPYTVMLKSGYITLTSQKAGTGIWLQELESLPDGVYTLAVKTTDGLYCKTYSVSAGMDGAPLNLDHNWWANINTGATYPRVRLVHTTGAVGDAVSVVWVALYKGSYTAETLPPYVSKGYGQELTECRRYYRNKELLLCAKTTGNYFAIASTIEMRAVPTVTLSKFSPYGKTDITDLAGCTISANVTTKGLVNITYATLPTCAEHSAGALYVELSADL